MGVVDLEILEPRHGQRFVFDTPSEVQFSGRVVPGEASGSTDGGDAAGLHLRWYSSLHAPPPPDDRETEHYPLNADTDTGHDTFARVLRIGTHVLTFTARDLEGDSAEQLRRVERAGMTGGADTDDRCVITVLEAQSVEEPRIEASGSEHVAVLVARAPARWGRKPNVGNGEAPGYEPDPDYHERNTVGYRWLLIPDGDGDPVVTWAPRPEDDDLAFDTLDLGEDRNTPVVRFTPTLPVDLEPGRYRVILRVEDTADPDRWSVQDEQSVDIGGADR